MSEALKNEFMKFLRLAAMFSLGVTSLSLAFDLLSGLAVGGSLAIMAQSHFGTALSALVALLSATIVLSLWISGVLKAWPKDWARLSIALWLIFYWPAFHLLLWFVTQPNPTKG